MYSGENAPGFGKTGDKCWLFGKRGQDDPLFGKHFARTSEQNKANSDRQRLFKKESKYNAKKQRSHFKQYLKGIDNGFEKYVGCSLEEFRNYIQSLFTEGMTWENYREWHFDHKKPLCRFDLTKEREVKKAWHWSNLQPLWAIDNLIKGSKY